MENREQSIKIFALLHQLDKAYQKLDKIVAENKLLKKELKKLKK